MSEPTEPSEAGWRQAARGRVVSGLDVIREAVERALDNKHDEEGVEVAVYIVAQDGRRLRMAGQDRAQSHPAGRGRARVGIVSKLKAFRNSLESNDKVDKMEAALRKILPDE